MLFLHESGAKEEPQMNNVSQKLPSGCFYYMSSASQIPEGIRWLH